MQEGRGVSGALAAGLRPVAGDPAAGRNALREQVMGSIANALLAPASSPSRGVAVLQQLPQLLSAVNTGAARIGGGVSRAGGVLSALMAGRESR